MERKEKEKKKKRKNKIYVLVILLFVVALVLFLYSLYFKSSVVLEKKEIFAKLIVGEPAGFDVNGTALIFGRLPPTTSAKRKLILSNTYDFPIIAEFNVEGNIKDFLMYTSPVNLDIGERENVTVSTITIPQNTSYGNYTGIFIIVFKRVV